MLVRRGGARIVLALAKTSGFQLSGRSGGLFENGVGELADELLLGSGECGDLVDLALQFGSRAAFGGGGLLAEEVLDGDLESLGDGAEGRDRERGGATSLNWVSTPRRCIAPAAAAKGIGA